VKNKVILLVEDNPDDVQLTRRALKRNNILNPLVVADDGAKALEYLRQTDELPALVLLDLKLPKVDGLEVLRTIRSDPRLKLLPVVILTTSMEHPDVVESYSGGANSYVRKPVDFERFDEAVKQLGLYWLLLNEPPPERKDSR
jgi:two-component system response regulator